MRLQRITAALPRRRLLHGGLGLVTGAVIGGLQDDGARFAVDETPVAEPPPPTPTPPPAPTELRLGTGGEPVWALQERLGSLGYWCGTPDGGFGGLTQQAVFAVQKAAGLGRDGVVGPATQQALDTGIRPAAVAGGDHVEVHLGSQLLLVVRGGAPALVLNTSTGNGEPYTYEGADYVARTPTGDFGVWLTDGSGWRDGELGEMWRPMFYSGNYAIHGSASIPPWPASHGCARLSVSAMDLIWDQGLLQLGGRVLVV